MGPKKASKRNQNNMLRTKERKRIPSTDIFAKAQQSQATFSTPSPIRDSSKILVSYS